MPLYNNILQSQGKSDARLGGEELLNKSSSNASMKLLQDHLASKRRLQQQNTPNKVQRQTDNRSIHDPKLSAQIISESSLHEDNENCWKPEEEYDPMIPNSYEVLQSEYLKRVEEERIAAAARSTSKSSTGVKFNPNILEVLEKLDDEIDEDPSDAKVRGTAIAPPPSLSATTTNTSSASDTDRTDIPNSIYLKSNNSALSSEPFSSPFANPTKKLEGGSVAAKIMSKMGYKVGAGLGKDEQGISCPLEVEKSGTNAGRILPTSSMLPQKNNPDSNQANFKDDREDKMRADSTRVLLLQNMVGPGEVDDDLEAETKEECKKYGDVVKCLIYEIPNKRVPDSEAVRIYVEFSKVESAMKAVSDLNGRYFGGRVVKASFYNLERFNKYELGP